MTNQELLEIIEQAAKNKVTKLDLSSKGLKMLPAEIGQLTNLSQLYLDNNPLESPPPEIRKKGFRAILNFYKQQLEQESDRLYEAKLLIVGRFYRKT
ncbi:Miro domain-containing protein [Nostoc sp. NIES-4103]|nr:Miro domain-containing protein [Nostoc sp. NIES-4103]